MTHYCTTLCNHTWPVIPNTVPYYPNDWQYVPQPMPLPTPCHCCGQLYCACTCRFRWTTTTIPIPVTTTTFTSGFIAPVPRPEIPPELL